VRMPRTEMSRGWRASTRGYVLVEVMVSLVVFSIGMLSVMRTFSVAIHARALAHDYTIATFLCQKLLDESRVAEGSRRARNRGTFDTRFRWVREVTDRQDMSGQQGGQLQRDGRWQDGQWQPGQQQGGQSPQQLQQQGHTRLTVGGERRRAFLNRRNTESEDDFKPQAVRFDETTVTVSWTRKGASYDVSVKAKVPMAVPVGAVQNGNMQEGVYTDRNSRRDDDILRRDDRGVRGL